MQVEEIFYDKNALKAPAPSAGDGDVIKVTGPVKKQFFSPEEAKSI